MTDVSAKGALDRLNDLIDGRARQFATIWTPDAKAVALEPENSYFEVWLDHSFLKKRRRWTKKRMPAAYVAVKMDAAGESTAVNRVVEPPARAVGPGVWSGYPVTGQIPYRGGTVELSAGLFALESASGLGVALGILANLSSLLAPPLSAAVQIAGTVAAGTQKVIEDGMGKILLGTHRGFAPPPGDGEILSPGHLAVVGAPQSELDIGRLCVKENILHRREGGGSAPLEGYDYLLLTIRSRRQRSDWRFPRFTQLMERAMQAHFAGEPRSYGRFRNELLAEISTCADLTASDRWRVIRIVKAELESLTDVSHRFEDVAVPTFEKLIETHSSVFRDPAAAREIPPDGLFR